MKKLLPLILCFTILLSLTACTGEKRQDSSHPTDISAGTGITADAGTPAAAEANSASDTKEGAAAASDQGTTAATDPGAAAAVDISTAAVDTDTAAAGAPEPGTAATAELTNAAVPEASTISTVNPSVKANTASGTSPATAPETAAVNSVKASGDHQPVPGTFQRKYIPKYAKGFHVEYYYGGAKIIDTHIAATATTGPVSQRVLILPDGAATPVKTNWQYTIKGSITDVVTLASAHAGHFSNLDAISIVKGTSISPDSCYIPSLKAALQSGATKYVGSGAKADKELIASLKPQIVFVGGMQSDIELAQKLAESGIFCFYFGDFAEKDYIGRAQWIELIGALIGREKLAQDFVQRNVREIVSIVQRTSKIEKRPKVLWFTHSSQAPHWNLRTDADYVNSIVTTVGGKLYYPLEAKESSITLSNEAFLQYMMGADKIIFGVSLNSYKSARDITYFNKEGQVDFSRTKAFRSNDCYVVGYDWAQDTANAADIIKAMAVCLYPEEFKDLAGSGKIMKFKVN
jgi:ABC-type Fe3+-hydroxamate transport system substrate-binding protein